MLDVDAVITPKKWVGPDPEKHIGSTPPYATNYIDCTFGIRRCTPSHFSTGWVKKVSY